MQQGATMAMGPTNPTMAMDTNRRPGTAMDQRPAMVMASNRRLTVAANQLPGTATDQRLATATSRRLATATSRGLATATSRGLAMVTGQCPATVIGTNQRRGVHVPLGRQPIRQVKMLPRCRRTCPHLLLVDDDRRRTNPGYFVR